MLVLALPGAARLAADLAHHLRCEWSELAQHRFPDGESLVRIDAPVEGRCVVLAGSLDQPDAKTLPLLFAADAARELGAAQVGLAAPYLAYMQQDRRFNPGEAITSRTYARLLSSSLDFLVTVDPHLHRWRALEELYPIRTRVVESAPAIARWVRSNVDAPMLVGPASESAQWVEHVARLCDAPWTVMDKTRRGDREVSVQLAAAISWEGHTPVLLDDIVSTGNTMVAAVETLVAANARPPVCIAVHALLDGDVLRRLMRAGIAHFVSCDTIPHPTNAIAIAPDLAKAVHSLAGAATPHHRSHANVFSQL
ncbi:MAG: ribose-phosphate pyrophosphokinase [Pseudomonadota bacterium]